MGDKVQTSVSTAKGLKYGNLADEGFPGGSWRTDHYTFTRRNPGFQRPLLNVGQLLKSPMLE